MTQASLKGTKIVLVYRENLDDPVAYVTALPIDKVRAQIQDPNLKIEGEWLWRIDQIPVENDAPHGFNFYVQWSSIHSIMLFEHTILALDLDYEITPPMETFERFGEDDDSDPGGTSVQRITGPRRPSPGGHARKPPALVS